MNDCGSGGSDFLLGYNVWKVTILTSTAGGRVAPSSWYLTNSRGLTDWLAETIVAPGTVRDAQLRGDIAFLVYNQHESRHYGGTDAHARQISGWLGQLSHFEQAADRFVAAHQSELRAVGAPASDASHLRAWEQTLTS